MRNYLFEFYESIAEVMENREDALEVLKDPKLRTQKGAATNVEVLCTTKDREIYDYVNKRHNMMLRVFRKTAKYTVDEVLSVLQKNAGNQNVCERALNVWMDALMKKPGEAKRGLANRALGLYDKLPNDAVGRISAICAYWTLVKVNPRAASRDSTAKLKQIGKNDPDKDVQKAAVDVLADISEGPMPLAIKYARLASHSRYPFITRAARRAMKWDLSFKRKQFKPTVDYLVDSICDSYGRSWGEPDDSGLALRALRSLTKGDLKKVNIAIDAFLPELFRDGFKHGASGGSITVNHIARAGIKSLYEDCPPALTLERLDQFLKHATEHEPTASSTDYALGAACDMVKLKPEFGLERSSQLLEAAKRNRKGYGLLELQETMADVYAKFSNKVTPAMAEGWSKECTELMKIETNSYSYRHLEEVKAKMDAFSEQNAPERRGIIRPSSTEAPAAH